MYETDHIIPWTCHEHYYNQYHLPIIITGKFHFKVTEQSALMGNSTPFGCLPNNRCCQSPGLALSFMTIGPYVMLRFAEDSRALPEIGGNSWLDYGFAVCKIVPPLMVFPPSLVSANYGLLHMETGDPLPLTVIHSKKKTFLYDYLVHVIKYVCLHVFEGLRLCNTKIFLFIHYHHHLHHHHHHHYHRKSLQSNTHVKPTAHLAMQHYKGYKALSLPQDL